MHVFLVNFSIGNIDEFSHHCCLSFVMRVNIPELSRDDINLTPHPTSFVWNANMRNNSLRDVINSDEVQNKMISIFADETSCDVNRLVDDFTEILRDSCHKVLSIKKQKKINKNKQKQSQKWYNNNCYALKKNLRNLGILLAIIYTRMILS